LRKWKKKTEGINEKEEKRKTKCDHVKFYLWIMIRPSAKVVFRDETALWVILPPFFHFF
jgi:hypothetical protein